jgi:hypothetical protein
MKLCVICILAARLIGDHERTKDWSGKEDLNLRPPGPEATTNNLILLIRLT